MNGASGDRGVTRAPRTLWFLLPGDVNALTGGYGYDRRVISALGESGWTVNVRPLHASFPFPTTAAANDAAAALQAIPDGSLVMIDGLALGAMPDQVRPHAARLRVVALVHHPLALETGLSQEDAARLFESERRALGSARAVVVTSDATARTLGTYGVSPVDVVVAEPGVASAPVSRGSHDGVGAWLTVASLTPRKGYDVLLDALAALDAPGWHLTCVGGAHFAPDTARQLERRVRDLTLSDRVTFAGELSGSTLDQAYDAADVFVLATRYEGYGMVVAEALAHGLPVLSTSTGAIPALVGRDAGIVVSPGDTEQLADALKRWMTDPALRERLRTGARARRRTLPDWTTTAARIAMMLERTASR